MVKILTRVPKRFPQSAIFPPTFPSQFSDSNIGLIPEQKVVFYMRVLQKDFAH